MHTLNKANSYLRGGKLNCKYLRKEKVEVLLSALLQSNLKNDLKVEKYDDAVILPGKHFDEFSKVGLTLGGVIDEFGKYVELSKNSALFGGAYKTVMLRQSEKTVVYAGYFEHHWGHFLVDIVPRLWYALENDEEIDEYIIVCCEGSNQLLQDNFFEFLDLLGISDRIRILTEPTKFKRVIVPQLSYKYEMAFDENHGDKYYSEKYIDTFNHVIEKALDLYHQEGIVNKKVFFTRSQLEFASERDIGIEMLDSFFKNNGYCVLSPEKMSLKELIFTVNNCSDIACIQGSAQHNLLFAKGDINTIVIERYPMSFS